MSSLPYGDYRPDDPAITIPASARLLVDEFLRDPHILAAPDGAYYLTGTTRLPEHPNALTWNRGVRLWRSRDLRNWDDLGFVWELDHGPSWLRRYAISGPEPRWLEPAEFQAAGFAPNAQNVRRCVWAPEIHYLPRQRTYVIAASANHNMGIPTEHWVGDTFGGTFLLRSTSGRPEGPYEVTSEGPITDLVDMSLLVEEDGSVWLVGQGGRTGRLEDDLASFRHLRSAWQKEFPVRPDYAEGDYMLKRDGRYFFFQAINGNRRADGTHTYGNERDLAARHVSYDMLLSSASRMMGPYGPRRTVLVGGGHGSPFCDHEGCWWTTVFSKPGEWRPVSVPDQCRPYLVPMRWDGEHFVVDPTR